MARKNKGQSAPELSALPGAFSSSFRVSANALDVIRRIKKTGRCAFIVGGAVRDALTGGAPADFDIATESWPSFVVKAVPGSRTQGRRFIIVVRDFGRETVEITTFRRESARRERFGSNRYGSLMDDAMARDFTINALYLDPFAGVILDPLDVTMDVFLPSKDAVKVRVGDEARIVIDGVDAVFPAKVDFVADDAQFTPKFVETREERDKLRFRIILKVGSDTAAAHPRYLKGGMPAVAYLRTENTSWPGNLAVKLPEESAGKSQAVSKD